MRILRIHHLTVAVRDLDRARATFASLLGAETERDGVVPAFGVRSRELALGEDMLQLVQPLEADSPVMRFIERKGEGLYNVALEVDDVAAAVRELASRGVRVSQPVETAPGEWSAFITMSATHGLSIQLIQLPPEAEEPPEAEHAPVAEPAAAVAPEPEPEAAHPPLDLTPDEWSDLD